MQHNNFSLKQAAFFKTGGCCDVYYEPENREDLKNFVINNRGKKLIVLGAMSNVVVPDTGIRGVVIHFGKEFRKIEFLKGGQVLVEAGVYINDFIEECASKNISCIEEMYMIPGTIGGAILMNAGTPIFEISEVVNKIECLDKNTGEILFLNKEEFNFSYRNSSIPENFIIVSVILKTKELDKKIILSRTREILEKRKRNQPFNVATCGSTFKNPRINKITAWELIESSGCKGKRIGGAVVSNIHSNFIVNEGGATSNDIINLIDFIKKAVYEKHGILLEEEIRIIQ